MPDSEKVEKCVDLGKVNFTLDRLRFFSVLLILINSDPLKTLMKFVTVQIPLKFETIFFQIFCFKITGSKQENYYAEMAWLSY